MREILFRAKAINRVPGREYRTKYKNGDWVYGFLEKPPFLGWPAEMRNEDMWSGIEVDFDTIGQYTGLKDKKRKKIFEGDIVRVVSSGEIAVVKWDEIESRFYFDAEGYGICIVSKAEVLGNIYDNPELLGGDTDA